jgi:diadenosine tetraphosphate (Ap4A) HIT family hydrolase
MATGRLKTMPENQWPPDFAAMRRGEGCPMCGPGAEETPHGFRVFEGPWADGYLGRYPVRPGSAYVIWKGRHVAEPTDLSAEEAAGFWADVALVAAAVEAEYRPAKMNWLSLGNGVPHLHVHLVPRPLHDARAGGPLEPEAFDAATTPPVAPAQLAAEAAALRARLRG